MISLITGVGASGQVGEAVAGALALRGDHVLLVSREASEVRERAAELTKRGLKASAYACDLADPSAVDELAGLVGAAHSAGIDSLVNLAGGFGSTGPISESDPAGLHRMLQINLVTAYLATRALLPLLRQTRGSIVYFASEAVLEGGKSKGVAAYAAAKAGVIALMRSVADEARDWGVRSNALAPGSIRTATNESSMGSQAAYVEREEVARVVEFLCSPAASAISGQVIRLRGSPGV